MISFLTRIFGNANDRVIKKFKKELSDIGKYEKDLVNLSDIQIKGKTEELRLKLKNGASLDDIKHEAFAIVREAAKRVLGQRHYDVQILGGLILHKGMVAEMRTGEGKTLVATLPAYLHALEGKGVHVVTVNDYLAKRDSEWMGKVFNFLGLTTSYIIGNMNDEKRKEAYNCDITYATNNELGFDYLRDNMKFTLESKAQKSFNYAIIDEVDSILIDEARTPLIISGSVEDNTEIYSKIDKLIQKLQSSSYEIDEKTKSAMLTESGINDIEAILLDSNLIKKESSLYDVDNLNLVHHINQSLRANFIYTKDKDYIIDKNKIMIIDEFTGRVMDGRRYSDGLHQAIEAKENVAIQNENQTLASITFQNYFRIYPLLSGMTGTAMTEASELKDIYNLDVVSIPTHNKITRIDHEDLIYGTKAEKYNAIIELIKDCHERGQPVLVGTISIEKSEEISKELLKYNIKHNILNAKMHKNEAYIIAQAGRYKAVTIATNMAGRGTDIMLGGNPDMAIEALGVPATREDIKKISTQITEEKEKVIKAGGLYVIGTERHESRRIDNQLRGRSGRQGDIGSTKFFLSLDDDLMRIFASDKISSVLRTLGLKDGESIHHPMITRSVAKAQQKVEGHNYEIRKNLLKFDDVMNNQRKIIYQQRNDIIESKDIGNFVNKMSEELCISLTNQFIEPNSLREDWKLEELSNEIYRIFGIKWSADEIADIEGTEEDIKKSLNQKVQDIFQKKLEKYGDVMHSASKYTLLTTFDKLWKDHLHNLDYLRQGISLRAYGQKDPLNEYKREAFGLFEGIFEHLRELFIQRICLIQIDINNDQSKISLDNKMIQESQATRSDPAMSRYSSDSPISVKAKQIKSRIDPKDRDKNNPESWGKISRNELCPCESGKKYKYCHGAGK